LEHAGTGGQNLYVAGEYNYTDGPFDKPQHFNRLNLFAKYNRWLDEHTRLNFQASTFTSRWDASGQIPERAVASGSISRWGAIDSTEGGNTGRTNLSLSIDRWGHDRSRMQSLFYFSAYDFNLYSNFTLFLNDPVFGDEIRQRENRRIYGMEHSYARDYALGRGTVTWKSGLGLRYDDIGNIELTRVYQRTTPLDTLFSGVIGQANLNVHTSLEWLCGKWMVNSGLRADYFLFNVEDRLQPALATQGKAAFRLSPKLNFFYTPDDRRHFFLKTGMGFHSNDARVVVSQPEEQTLPYSIEGDLGALFKPLPGLVIQPALWFLYLQQEFVYVGDEAVVEASGETRRYGIDLTLRYQPLKWLYLDADVNYACACAIGEPKGEDYIPLAPALTSVGGVTVRFASGLTAGIRYRYMADRPANEDNSVVAKGYFVNDLTVTCPFGRWELNLQAQNLFNVAWNEAQFDTETRLQGETESSSEICFTPGNPFLAKVGLKVSF
jgi:hypothetical protein